MLDKYLLKYFWEEIKENYSSDVDYVRGEVCETLIDITVYLFVFELYHLYIIY